MQEYNRLKSAGFTDPELRDWSTQQTQKLQAAGFKPSEVDAYWGNAAPSSPELEQHVANNTAAAVQAQPELASDPVSAFFAGWDRSVGGLVVNRHTPRTALAADAPVLNRVAEATGQFVGDAPWIVTGFVAGAGIGAGLTAETGPGAAVGAAAGGGAGAGFLPSASREVLLDTYASHEGNVKSWQDALSLATKSGVRVMKDTAIGSISQLVGGKVGTTALKAGASEFVAGGANATAQVVTATTTGAALDGHVPDAADFETAAVLTLGLHVGGAVYGRVSGKPNPNALRVQNNLEKLYRETGIPPWEASKAAADDPALKAELLAQDVNGERAGRLYNQIAPDEPKPFVDRAREVTPPVDRARGEANPRADLYALDVPHAKDLLRQLEGSADDAVSPAGAIGRYQIMPGTARLYMGKDFDVKTLFDPKVNEEVATRIITDLHRRYNGDMNAIAIAYNAGTKRAGEYLKAGPGFRLEAERDPSVRGGIRYTKIASAKDESFLPLETQKYLANGRRRMGGDLPKGENGEPLPEAAPEEPDIPMYEEPQLAEGEKAPYETDVSEATKEILANIGEEPSRPSLVEPDRVLGQFISELTPARRIDDRLISAGAMDRARDVGAEDMFRQTYASDTRAGAFIRYGAVDANTLDIKPGSSSMMDAVKAVKEDGGDMKEWVAYMLAKRANEKAMLGVDTGFNPRAAGTLANDPKTQAKYQRATDIFQEVVNSALEYSKDSGVHSQAAVDAMVRDNPTYISMRRVMGDDASFEASGRGFRARDSLKRMEGSNRQIVDPLAATIDNIRLLVKNADRNRAIGHIVNLVESEQLPELGIKQRSTRSPQVIALKKLIDDMTDTALEPYGLDAKSAKDAYASLIAERAWKNLDANDFIYFRDGKPEVWTTDDPELARLLRKADSPGEANIVMQTFQTFSKMKRAGIVLSPDFPVRNVLRDQLQAFVLDPHSPPPFVTWVRGIMHVVGQDKTFQDLVAKGGFGSALADMDTDWLARDMDKVFNETGTFKGVVNLVKHPIELAQIVSERIDAGSRVGYYLHTTGKGLDPLKAATLSRKAYLDFAERGTSQVANNMAKVTAFFRPTLLGWKQLGEAVAERPVTTVSKAALAIGVPMVALYALNWLQDQALPDGEKYSDLPRWQRDHYFITPSIAGVRFRLQTPPEVGFVFGGMVNRALDAMANKDKHAFDGWAKAFLQNYLPSLMPDLTTPPVEAITNHSFFSGQPLVPDSLAKASGYMQYTQGTTETGKALARMLGYPGLNVADMSPIQFDNYVRGWTGSLGMGVLKTLDVPFHATKRPWEVADIPFVGSFTVRTPGMSAQPVQDFFDAMGKLETKHQDFALAMKHAEGGQVNNDVELTAQAGQYAQAVSPIKDAIMVMSSAIQAINANPDMTDAEKRQSIDALYPQLVQTAKAGLDVIDQLPPPQKPQADAGGGVPPGDTGGSVPAAPPPVGANRGMVPVA